MNIMVLTTFSYTNLVPTYNVPSINNYDIIFLFIIFISKLLSNILFACTCIVYLYQIMCNLYLDEDLSF